MAQRSRLGASASGRSTPTLDGTKMTVAEFDAEAKTLLDQEIEQLSRLSFEDAKSLPECEGRDIDFFGHRASLTTFRYVSPYGLDGHVLVVALAALPIWLGMAARHIERGIVFSEGGLVREATQTELENSGG